MIQDECFISIQIITVLVTWRKAYANETCCTKGGNPIWQKKQEQVRVV